jgi:hypothetical protein
VFARENLSLLIRGLDADLAVASRNSVNRSCNEP